MITNNDVIRILEQLRISKHISITKMTNGVMSPRNYNRLINSELDISIDNLLGMLDNLGTPFEDFFMYANSIERLENIDFENCVICTLFNNFNKANYYYEKLKDEFNNFDVSVVRNNTISKRKDFLVSKTYLDYQNNKISLDACKVVLSGIIKLSEFGKGGFLYSEDIISLIIYLKICNDTELEMIGKKIISLINDKEHIVIGRRNSVINYLAYYAILYCFVMRKNINREDMAIIREYYLKVIEFYDKIQLSPYNVMMCELLYHYIKRRGIVNKSIIFDYVSSIISNPNELFMTGRKYDLYKEDIELYYELLKNDKFIRTRLTRRSSYV